MLPSEPSEARSRYKKDHRIFITAVFAFEIFLVSGTAFVVIAVSMAAHPYESEGFHMTMNSLIVGATVTLGVALGLGIWLRLLWSIRERSHSRLFLLSDYSEEMMIGRVLNDNWNSVPGGSPQRRIQGNHARAQSDGAIYNNSPERLLSQHPALRGRSSAGNASYAPSRSRHSETPVELFDYLLPRDDSPIPARPNRHSRNSSNRSNRSNQSDRNKALPAIPGQQNSNELQSPTNLPSDFSRATTPAQAWWTTTPNASSSPEVTSPPLPVVSPIVSSYRSPRNSGHLETSPSLHSIWAGDSAADPSSPGRHSFHGILSSNSASPTINRTRESWPGLITDEHPRSSSGHQRVLSDSSSTSAFSGPDDGANSLAIIRNAPSMLDLPALNAPANRTVDYFALSSPIRSTMSTIHEEAEAEAEADAEWSSDSETEATAKQIKKGRKKNKSSGSMKARVKLAILGKTKK